jgi:hypothetical protein
MDDFDILERMQNEHQIFLARFNARLRNPGTLLANFDCEKCGAVTHVSFFDTVQYPDLTIKALCRGCSITEFQRMVRREEHINKQ